MPWKIVPDHPECDGNFAVVKEDNGEVEGCHETRDGARAQQSALYASEEKMKWTAEARKKLAAGEIRGAFAGPDQSYPIADSSDVGDAWGLAGQAANPDQVRRNIIRIAKKYGWTSGLPESAKKWAQENGVSLKENSMETTGVLYQLLAKSTEAIGRILGFPQEDDPASQNLGEDKDLKQEDVPSIVAAESPSFRVWKQGDTYRWLAIYSNNYRDEDAPPEIISAKSHENFVKMFDSGEVPKPELWLWHTPGTAFGDVDMLDFTDDGMAVASGTIRKGKEHIAQRLGEMPNLGVSHGMDADTMERDAVDKSVITRHVTREISPLPLWAAANKRTRFAVLRKETSMAMSNEKKQFLANAGLSDEEIQNVEQTGKEIAEEAQSSGVESKEAEVQEEPKGEPETKTEETQDFATKVEVAEAMAEVLKALTTQISEMTAKMNEVSEQVNSFGAVVKEMQQSDEERLLGVKESSPRATVSILDLMGRMGPTGAKEVGENDPLKAKKPRETVVAQTGIGFLDEMFSEGGQ